MAFIQVGSEMVYLVEVYCHTMVKSIAERTRLWIWIVVVDLRFTNFKKI
jgi:hypothetical protein